MLEAAGRKEAPSGELMQHDPSHQLYPMNNNSLIYNMVNIDLADTIAVAIAPTSRITYTVSIFVPEISN